MAKADAAAAAAPETSRETPWSAEHAPAARHRQTAAQTSRRESATAPPRRARLQPAPLPPAPYLHRGTNARVSPPPRPAAPSPQASRSRNPPTTPLFFFPLLVLRERAGEGDLIQHSV